MTADHRLKPVATGNNLSMRASVVVLSVLVLLGVVGVVLNLHDIRRYLRMRQM